MKFYHCNCTSGNCRGATNRDSAFFCSTESHQTRLTKDSSNHKIKQAELSSQKSNKLTGTLWLQTELITFPQNLDLPAYFLGCRSLTLTPLLNMSNQVMCSRSWPANKPCKDWDIWSSLYRSTEACSSVWFFNSAWGRFCTINFTQRYIMIHHCRSTMFEYLSADNASIVISTCTHTHTCVYHVYYTYYTVQIFLGTACKEEWAAWIKSTAASIPYPSCWLICISPSVEWWSLDCQFLLVELLRPSPWLFPSCICHYIIWKLYYAILSCKNGLVDLSATSLFILFSREGSSTCFCISFFVSSNFFANLPFAS